MRIFYSPKEFLQAVDVTLMNDYDKEIYNEDEWDRTTISDIENVAYRLYARNKHIRSSDVVVQIMRERGSTFDGTVYAVAVTTTFEISAMRNFINFLNHPNSVQEYDGKFITY